MKNSVITRFAPSPTGLFHAGGIRSALYNYLFARKHGGTFILRCDDTDSARSKKEYEDYFLEVFNWLNLEYDSYFRQSERKPLYRTYLEKMIKDGTAYISKEIETAEGEREEVIRFKNPNKKISFKDEVLGDITFDTKELGDFVIAREMDDPLYHFTTVVDDFEMKITHIIRGQEHVSNTPRQILIQEAIGAPRPIYAHASIILDKERKKLSKRDPNVFPVLEYKKLGYLPDALLNFMALIGWNPGTEQEIFSKKDLINAFSLEKLQKAGAIFDPQKLEWVNREHIKLLTKEQQIDISLGYFPKEFSEHPLWNNELGKNLASLALERIHHFGEIEILAGEGEFSYFLDEPKYDTELLYWKGDKELDESKKKNKTKQILESVNTLVNELEDEAFNSPDAIKALIWPLTEDLGRGDVLWPLRVALSGKERSPDPFTLLFILKKKRSLERIEQATKLLT